MKRFAVPALVVILVVFLLVRGIHIGSVTHDPKRLKSCRYLEVFGITSVPVLNDEKCSWFLR